MVTTCGIFFATPFAGFAFNGISEDVYFPAYNLLLALVGLTELHALQSAGQAASNAYKRLKESCDRLRLGKGDVGEELSVLSERSSSVPIRPMDIFNLNYASAASIYGMVLTYLVVLMQFKGGEGI